MRGVSPRSTDLGDWLVMHGGTQTICFWAFGGYNMSTGGVKAHVAASCGCKAGWFERWLSRP